jgi:hypothetical protein
MIQPRPWDASELDAGDVHRLAAPDPDRLQAIRVPAPSGDLDDAAKRLGVDVADLVTMRRKLGIAPTHRRPSRWTRLFRKG